MAGMPGLISDREGSSYSQLSAAMHAFAECMVHGIMWTIPFFFAQRQFKKKKNKNVVDVLNKVNSLLVQQGLHHRKESPILGGAAQRVLSWENTDSPRNGDLASHDVN